MSDARIDNAVREFYAEQQPKAETVRQLVGEVADCVTAGDTTGITGETPVPHLKSPAERRWRALPWAVAAAACVAAYFAGYTTPRSSAPAGNSGIAGAPRTNPAIAGNTPVRDGDETLRTTAAITNVPIAHAEPQNPVREAIITAAEREAHRGLPALATIPQVDGEDAENPAMTAAPALLLIKVSADWCPRSPRVAPIFDQLASKYANQPLLIVSFDVTTPESRKQCAYLAHSLGVLKVLGHKWEPGMIRLIDRQHAEILESLREVEEQPHFEQTLVHSLSPRATPASRP